MSYSPIEKHSSLTGDGNPVEIENPSETGRKIEKHSSPTGDGNLPAAVVTRLCI